jgi:hypothetical protein
MGLARIVIKASDVAAIIGKNQYKPREEVLSALWKRYSPETFAGQTKEDRAEEALGASVTAQKVLEKATAVKARDSAHVQAVFNNAREAINLDNKLSTTQKAEVIEHLRSKVYTTHGTRSEDKTADKVAQDEGVRLIRDDSFYNVNICIINGVHFVVCGKIDRIEERPDGSRVLVEIKNRTNRLFRRVVEYEMVQVQVYLQMLGLVHARLVEQYNNQVATHDIDRDEGMWHNEIVPGLQAFCSELLEKMKYDKVDQ